MLNISKAPFIVGVLNPKHFDDDLTYLSNHQPHIIEYRADFANYSDISSIKNHLTVIREKINLPILFTLRDKTERGNFSGSNLQKNNIFLSVINLIDAIDLEAALAGDNSEIIAIAKEKNLTVILSYHNFDKTPDLSALEIVINNSFDAGADISKIATLCDQKNDALRLLSLPVKFQNIATVGMGKYGPLTRVAAPALGSLLAYAFTDNSSALIPGQLTVEQLKLVWKLIGI